MPAEQLVLFPSSDARQDLMAGGCLAEAEPGVLVGWVLLEHSQVPPLVEILADDTIAPGLCRPSSATWCARGGSWLCLGGAGGSGRRAAALVRYPTCQYDYRTFSTNGGVAAMFTGLRTRHCSLRGFAACRSAKTAMD